MLGPVRTLSACDVTVPVSPVNGKGVGLATDGSGVAVATAVPVTTGTAVTVSVPVASGVTAAVRTAKSAAALCPVEEDQPVIDPAAAARRELQRQPALG